MIIKLFGKSFIEFHRDEPEQSAETVNNYFNSVFQEIPVEQPSQNTASQGNTIIKQITGKEQIAMVNAIAKETNTERSIVDYILRLSYEYLCNGKI